MCSLRTCVPPLLLLRSNRLSDFRRAKSESEQHMNYACRRQRKVCGGSEYVEKFGPRGRPRSVNTHSHMRYWTHTDSDARTRAEFMEWMTILSFLLLCF